jgi:hypothetical protein
LPFHCHFIPVHCHQVKYDVTLLKGVDKGKGRIQERIQLNKYSNAGTRAFMRTRVTSHFCERQRRLNLLQDHSHFFWY